MILNAMFNTSNQMGTTGDFVKVFEQNGFKMENMGKMSFFSNIIVPYRDLTGGADMNLLANNEGTLLPNKSGMDRGTMIQEQPNGAAYYITDKTGYKRVNSFYTNGEVKVDRPEDADTIEYFFFVETWGYIVLMVKDEPTTLTPEEEAKEREEQLKQERKDAAVKALSEATARAYELRADFVATVSAAAIKKRLADIVALWAYAEYWDDTGWLTEEEIAQATGAETLTEEDEDSEDDAAFTLQAVTDAIGKTPEKALLRMIYARLGDCKSEGYFRSYWKQLLPTTYV